MRKSVEKLIKSRLKFRVKLLQIIISDDSSALDGLDGILEEYYKEIIHYDALQGFDVPLTETVQQCFPDTIDKWLHEDTFKDTVVVISDSDSLFDDKRAVIAVKSMVTHNSGKFVSQPDTVIIISNCDNLPKSLRSFSSIINIPLMNESECKKYIESWFDAKNICKEEEFINMLSLECLGLTEMQIDACVSEVMSEKNDKKSKLRQVQEIKARMMTQTGLIQIEKPCNKEELGGYESLKEWLQEIKNVKETTDNNLKNMIFPKGMLLVGVTGCGKSLCAKVSAGILDVPLLRIDFGNLMNKYVGESEKNLSNALQVVEAMAPCVLWIDEFEKAFGHKNDGNEVSQRMLGKFLTWLQEREGLIFTIATVNNVSKLPPELLRRGRFDKVYYVDLPDNDERKAIIYIHAQKLKITLNSTEISKISSSMEGKGYSGADIEYLLKEARRRLISYPEKDTIETIFECIDDTKSVENIMSVEISEMKNEFKARGFEGVNKVTGRKNSRLTFSRRKNNVSF